MEDSNWRPLPGEEDVAAPLEHLKAEPGHYWRGMSGAEYANVLTKDEIKSQRGRTFYSTDPHTALRFLKRRHKPGTTSYLLKFRDPGLPTGDGLTRYPHVTEAIPGHNIVEEYMVNDDMVPHKVGMTKNSCVMDIGRDIEVYQIDPVYDPVQAATAQGAQLHQEMATVSAWKEGADDDVPEIGSQWRWRGRTLTVTHAAGDHSVAYTYEDTPNTIDTMPLYTWQTYVTNGRIKPYDPDAAGFNLTEPLVGWRVWNIDRNTGYLDSPVRTGNFWKPGERFEADMRPGMDHRAGAYACDTRQTLAEKQGTLDQYPVLGEVSMWGTVVKATQGFRSQYCYPSVLYIRDRSLIPLLEQYNVPIVWEDTAIFRFQADGWTIDPKGGQHRNGQYLLLDAGGNVMAEIEADHSLEGTPSDIDLLDIHIQGAEARNTTVQHIAYWIETLVNAGVNVKWAEHRASNHSNDGYEMDYDWEKQETHEVHDRSDLLALEEALLTDRSRFTESQGDPEVTYEIGGNKDEYGLDLYDATYLEQPPDGINLTMGKWVTLFQEMLQHIYEAKTDTNGFNLAEPQDIKSLVETFWTTLAGTAGDSDVHSAMNHLNLAKVFAPIYSRLVHYAQALDRMNSTGQPQQEQLFDPDQYVNGVRIANPLARFALQYLENLYDMTHGATVYKNGPDSAPNVWHHWESDPGQDQKNWKHVTVPGIPNTFSNWKVSGVDPQLFDVVYGAYIQTLMANIEDVNLATRHVIGAVEMTYGNRYSMEQIGEAIRWCQKVIGAVWPDTPGGAVWTDSEAWRDDPELPEGLQEQLDTRTPNDPVHSVWKQATPLGGAPYFIEYVEPPRVSPAFAGYQVWCGSSILGVYSTLAETGHAIQEDMIKKNDYPSVYWADQENPAKTTVEELLSMGDTNHMDIPGGWTLNDMGIPPEDEERYRNAALKKHAEWEWTLDDVRDSQAYVNQQLHALINWQGVTPEQANTAILDELHQAEMPSEWAEALLLAAWHTLKGESPTGHDAPRMREIQPPALDSSLPDAETWMNAVYDPHTVENDWRTSSEG